MLYYILGILICFLIILTVFRPKKYKAKSLSLEMKEEDFLNGLRGLARESRIINHSSGYLNVNVFLPSFYRLYRILASKVKHSALTQGELWYYQNFYHLDRYINTFSVSGLNRLQYSLGGIRVVELSKFIVQNSYGILTAERIDKAIETINNEINLTIDENLAFKDAIGYAFIVELYKLCGRLIFKNKVERVAKRKGIREKYITSDIYLHFLYKSKNFDKVSKYTESVGQNEKTIEINYNKTLVENEKIGKNLFNLLINIDEIVQINKIVKQTYIYKKCANLEYFEIHSSETILSYIIKLSKIAKKFNMSEIIVLKKLEEFATFNKLKISIILDNYYDSFVAYLRLPLRLKKVKEKSSAINQYAYVALLTAVNICGLGGIYFLTKNIIFTVLSLLPLYFLIEKSINYLISLGIREKELPIANYKTIPIEHNTLVVVSEYFSCKEQASAAVKNLLSLKETAKDKNINYCILADLMPSDTLHSASDEEILNEFNQLIGVENVNIFVRERVKCGYQYRAYERKRGAMLCLAKYLMTGKDGEFSFILNRNMSKPTYILTLDCDNRVLTNSIKELINVIAHPSNEKLDMISIRSKFNLFSNKNYYSNDFFEGNYLEVYPNFSTLYYNMFGLDIYCGKGIFKLKRFYDKLLDLIPSQKLLSHDILEGAILKTASYGVVYEDAPNGFLSDSDREKRWQRGDIGLLQFVKDKWKNDAKEKVCAKKPLFYKFLIVRNVAHILKYPAMFLLFLSLGFFSSIATLAVVGGLFAIPYVIDGLGITLNTIKDNTRISYYVSKIAKLIMNMLKDLFVLPYKFMQNLVIYISTVCKIIANKNLLEWKTFYQSQKSKSYSLFLARTASTYMMLAIITGIGLYFGNIFGLIFGAYSLLSIIVLNIEYVKGLIPLENKRIKLSESQKALEYANKTYKYFGYIERKDFLPADNLQIKPYKGLSMTTSPTNIGYYLCSLISAYKLELDVLENVIEKLKIQIDNLKKLDKYHGNLYNWYFIDKKTTATNFVSSVDSGNLVACLIVLKEFLKAEGYLELKDEVDKLINETDLSALYDYKANMFYLGYDTLEEAYSGHYDLFASESRLLNYVYSSLSGKSINYLNLIRDYDGFGGNTLMSWSGTMFEYLMAELFLYSPKNSLTDKTNHNIISLQKQNKISKLFGISESGYYAFDDNLYYQYKAFGVKKIALDNSINDNVIAPYASIMAINIDKKCVLKNIEELKRNGLYSDYGFYEAVDFDGEKRILYSYMTHHQGMIMVALANFLADNYIKKLFFSDSRINGNKLLLTEKTSENRFYKTPQYSEPKIMTEQKYEVLVSRPQARGAGLTNGNISVFVDAYGNGFTKFNNIYLNYFDFDKYERKGSHFYVKNTDGEILTPTNFRNDDKGGYQLYHNSDKIILSNIRENIKEEIFLDDIYSTEVRKLTVKDYAESTIFYYEELSMCYKYEKESHKVFADMFISTEYDENNHLIIAQKTFKNGKSIFYGLQIRGAENIIVETNRFNFIGRNGDELLPKFVVNPTKSKDNLGDVLAPCFGFCCKSTNGDVEIVKLFGENKEEIYQKLTNIPLDYIANIEVQEKLKLKKLTSDLLYPLIYDTFNNEILKYADKYDKKEDFFIYNGNKSILYKLDSDEGIDSFKELTESISELKHFGIVVNLIVVYSDDFEGEIEVSLRKILSQKTINNFHLYKESGVGDDINDYAFIILDRKLEVKQTKIITFTSIEENYKPYELVAEEDVKYISGEGYFDSKNNYILNKTPQLPYSNVVCLKKGGFITTENGMALAYFENSRELKSLKFDNDAVTNKVYESVTVDDKREKVIIDGKLNFNKTYIVKKGSSEFLYESEILKSRVENYMIDDGCVRVKEIVLSNKEESKKSQRIMLDFSFQISPLYDNKFIFIYLEEDNFVIKNLLNSQKVYVKIVGMNKNSLETLEYVHQNNKLQIVFDVLYDRFCEIFILQSSVLIPNLTNEQIRYKKEVSLNYFARLNPFKICTNNKGLDILFNDYLAYQIVSSRLNGKCGYYQVGGATGFRDQLQDSIALLYSDSERVKEQILYSASRQYVEGDVMHWWHHEKFGLRTKISDDKLYLPYLVALYIDFTGDKSILKEKVPYLSSNVLGEFEHTRFENPPYADSESILKHCYKAIKNSLKFGKHNLMLLNGGDWNDGLDFIGLKGFGESVHLSMFCYEVLDKFIKYAEEKHQSALRDIQEKLKQAVESFAFQDKQYLRIYGDDNRWYGSANGDVYNIDLTVQSYATISGIGAKERQLAALQSVENSLVDKNLGIIKLLNAPLTPENYIGYISTYPKGVRENGGQYTHSAIWYLIALCKHNKTSLSYEHFRMINPIEKCVDKTFNNMYKGEPYVLSGDVYSNVQNKGRMGWSWYTGSASWCYKLILENYLGIKIEDKKLLISFTKPTELNINSIEYSYKDSVYKFNFVKGKENKITSNDIEVIDNSIQIKDRGEFEITVQYNNS